MEITSFILGVCAVIIIMMVVGTSVNYMTIKSLKEEVTKLRHVLDKRTDDIYSFINKIDSKIDTKEGELVTYADRLHNNLYDEMNKIYPYIDSRVDKLNDKTHIKLAELYGEIERVEKGYKEKINY